MKYTQVLICNEPIVKDIYLKLAQISHHSIHAHHRMSASQNRICIIHLLKIRMTTQSIMTLVNYQAKNTGAMSTMKQNCATLIKCVECTEKSKMTSFVDDFCLLVVTNCVTTHITKVPFNAAYFSVQLLTRGHL